MAKSRLSYTSVGRSSRRTASRTRIVVRQSYFWPDWQLNLWVILMLATGGVLIGISTAFVVQQNTLGNQGIPWIMPFGITVGTLTVVFILIFLILLMQRRLIPAIVMIGSFILMVLFLTGFIETAIQVFGSSSKSVQHSCQKWVNGYKSNNLSVYTLAWLMQNSICQSWYAIFSFWIVGTLCWIWMLVIGFQVAQTTEGEPV